MKTKINIPQIHKLIEKEVLMIKDDTLGLVQPTSLEKFSRKDMESYQIDEKYCGWNFIAEGYSFPLEEVEMFLLSKVELS